MQAPPRFQSDKLREKKRRLRKFKCIVGAIVFVLLLAGVTYISHHPGLRVQQLIVSDLTYTDRAAIELLIKEELEGRYLGLFAKSNSLFVPRSSIKRKISEQFPAVQSVNIDWRGRQVIAVKVSEHSPVARWCDTPVTPAAVLTHESEKEVAPALPQVPNDRSGSRCFVVNAQGVLFAPTTDVSTGMVTFYGTITTDPIRQQYSSPAELQMLLDFARLVRRLEIVITEVWTTTGEAYAFVTESGTQLYVSADDDVVSVFTNLETVIARDAINKAQFANIAYIDLRFGNRVFYKLR